MTTQARAQYFRARKAYDALQVAKANIEIDIQLAHDEMESAWKAAIKEANAELNEEDGEAERSKG